MTKNLITQPVVYITRDIERAIGLTPQKNYYIISNETPFANGLRNDNSNIILISDPKILDTHELLLRPETKKLIDSLTKPRLLVFKNTPLIEKICHDNDWTLLNPNAELAAQIEEKISQLEWLGDLQKFLPPHELMPAKKLKWANNKIIVQFNRAHTGSGTLLINSEEDVSEIKTKFPNRPIRVTKFIDGPVLTSNNVVWGDKVLHGPIMYQITGLSPFTQNQFATIGNDWDLGNGMLEDPAWNNYKKIVEEVGVKLARDGWRGLFGIDAILDSMSGEIYLIEINARQPASTTYESWLQKTNTTFDAHLSALLGLPNENFILTPIINGAQIIQRVTAKSKVESRKSKVESLKSLGLNVIEYPNTEPEKDFLRIQSKKSIMLAHNQLNDLGEKIAEILQ